MLTRTNDPTRQIFAGCEFSRIEINDAVNELHEQARILLACAKTLTDNFHDHNLVGTKLAAENMAEAAKMASVIVPRKIHQIETLSAHLGGVFGVHVRRRERTIG